MATYELRVDHTVPLSGQPDRGHNRWHPDIAPALSCAPGDEVVLQTRDAFDGQINLMAQITTREQDLLDVTAATCEACSR